ILGLYDLDPSDPDTADRIRRWWDGEDDEILDAIDISEMFEVDIPEDGSEPETDWAIISASTLDVPFRNAAYCLAGFDILALGELIESGDNRAFGNANTRDAIRNLVNVAMSEFVDEPTIFSAFDKVRERSLSRYSSDAEMINEVLTEVSDLATAAAEAHLPNLPGDLESAIAAPANSRAGSIQASGDRRARTAPQEGLPARRHEALRRRS